MKRLLVLALLLAATVTVAQSHTVTLSCVPNGIAGSNYHFWRTPCAAAISGGVCPAGSEGTFAIVGTAASCSYVDAAVVGNKNYSYYASAFCPTGGVCAANYAINVDSAASNHIGAAIPPDTVPPPSSLTITSMAMNFSHGTTTVTARWAGPVGNATTWRLVSGSTLLSSGTTLTTGSYLLVWSGKKLKTAPVLTVCDPALAVPCVSQTAS